MRGFNAGLVLAALVRAPFTRETPQGDGTSLFSADMTVAVTTERPNGSPATAYLPITMVGAGARNLVARLCCLNWCHGTLRTGVA